MEHKVVCTRREFMIGSSAVIILAELQNYVFATSKKEVSSHYVLIHDETRCNGCNLCVSICHKFNHIPKGYSRLAIAKIPVKINDKVTLHYFFRHSCQHCENAPCIKVCPTGASYQDNDGIVQIATTKCIGCGYCVSACPYQVRYLNPQTNIADKCDFCAQTRLSKGLIPVCAKVCPENALIFGREDNPIISDWIKKNKFYQYQFGGTGKPKIFRLAHIHSLIQEDI